MKQNENKKNRKKRSAILLMLLSFGLIGGSLFAFFSDIVKTDVEVQAGTLDITGDYQLYVNGSTTPLEVNQIENFNPGDVVVVKTKIENVGNKSAWVRDAIDFTTSDTALLSHLEIYEGEIARGDLETATPASLVDYKVVLEPQIIDGTGPGAETETAPEAIGANNYVAAFTIYFSEEATNESQSQLLKIKVFTQAIQYRNNTTKPDETTWSTVVIDEFGN